MPKENIEKLGKHAGVSPLTHPWGIHTSDANPWSAVSLFSWFESEEDLRKSIAEAWYDFDSEGAEAERTRASLSSALAKLDRLEAAHVDALNEAAGRAFAVEWVGHFDDLATGSAPGAVWIREQFRGHEDPPDQELQAPIAEADREEFAQFVEDFGS